ncbi:hypothetical protein NMG60_11016566 [Bertholletia excelsa]
MAGLSVTIQKAWSLKKPYHQAPRYGCWDSVAAFSCGIDAIYIASVGAHDDHLEQC